MILRKKSIATSMIYFIIPVVLVMFVIISTIGYNFSKKIIVNQLDNQMQTKLREATESIDRSLALERGLSQSLAQTVGVNPDLLTERDYEELLQRYISMYKETFGMGIWFEKGALKGKERYTPYAYREGDTIVLDETYTTGDLDIWSTDWYKAGEQTNGGWTKAYFDTVTNMSMVTMSYPIQKDSDLIGVITTDIDISRIQSFVKDLKIDYQGKAILVDSDGVYLAGVEEKLLTTENITDSDNTTFATASKEMLANDTGKNHYVEKDGEYYFYYATIPDTNWKIGISVSEKNLFQKLDDLFYLFLITGFVSTIVVVLFIILYATKMGKTAKKFSDMAELVAQGDLSHAFEEKDLKRKDELGDIGRALYTMQENLKDIIQNFQRNAVNIDNHAQNLSAFSEQMSATSENVADAIAHVAQGASNQQDHLQGINTTIHQLASDLDTMNVAIINVDGSTNSIRNMANESNKEMSNMKTSFELLNQTFLSLIEQVMSVETNVSSVQEMTNIIHAIADQTNLLALNAAIEAARAGDAGKGFSVVANEIRTLAEKSRESSEKIDAIIKGVSQVTGKMVGSTEEVNKELGSQKEQLTITMHSFQTIIQAVERILPDINQTKETSIKVQRNKDLILRELEKTGAISEEVAASAEEISASAEEMTTSTNEVSTSALSLGEMTNEMNEKINFFKLDK